MDEEIIQLKVPVIIKDINGVPSVELRRNICTKETMRAIVYAAMKGTKINIEPYFTNPLGSVSSLVEKKIIVYDEEQGVFRFLI